jgi:hypothetical protein
MATGSLTNMTVPLSSNQTASSQGLLMPKLKYRFRVSFVNMGTGIGTNVGRTTRTMATGLG